MKNIINRMVAMLMVICSLVSMAAPAFAAEHSGSGEYIEITSDTAILRTGPGKSYTKIDSVDLQLGDCLALTSKAYTINKHGNVWFEIVYNDTVAYLYESHAVIHQHNFNSVGDGLKICKCGTYTIDQNSSLSNVGYADTAGTLLTPDVVEAAAEMAAAMAAASKAAGAAIASSPALPVLAITVVAGAIIYMGVSASGRQISDVGYIRSDEDIQNLLESEYDPDAPYYKCCTIDGEATLLMARDGMNLTDAANYLKSTVKNPTYATLTALTEKALLSIWCYDIRDAERLGAKFDKFGKDYGYGTSTDYNCYIEDNKIKTSGNIYFQHYHLWYRPYGSFMKKVDDAHIFFGTPSFANHT